MKRILLASVLITIVCFLQSCLKDECTGTQFFIKQEAVWIAESDFRIDLKVEAPRALNNPGKIYSYGNYIFINERNEGIHIIDNSDNSNPKKVSFLPIDGNIDMAVKENILYADNISDLLSINISNPESPELISRTESIFDKPTDGNGNVLAYYVVVADTLELNCTDPRVGTQIITDEEGNIWQPVDDFISAEDGGPEYSPTGPQGGNTAQPSGVAGSMASFAIFDCYLYVIDQNKVDILDLRIEEEGPLFLNTFYVSGGIETLFPYKDKLFIGSASGMFIYDNADPVNPQFLSNFTHARACDPVVVKDNYAFVTLRDGTWCEGFDNQLDVVDITDLLNPRLVKTYPMDNPHGLAVQNNELYLCDGASGLKVFNITDVNTIDQNQLTHIKNIDTYDAIALPGKDVLLVIGADGFYQYDITDPENLKELSLIAVEQ